LKAPESLGLCPVCGEEVFDTDEVAIRCPACGAELAWDTRDGDPPRSILTVDKKPSRGV